MTGSKEMDVQPVFGEPALLLKSPAERVLAIADLHVGLKYQWERDGVFIPDQKKRLVDKIRNICEPMKIDRLVVIGDFKHHVPRGSWKERKGRWDLEREEIRTRIDTVVQQKQAVEERISSGGDDLHPVAVAEQKMLYRLEREKMRQVSRYRERKSLVLDTMPAEEEAVNLVLEELGGFLGQVDIVKGNHDGRLESIIDPSLKDFVTVHRAEGFLYKIGEKVPADEEFGGPCSVGFLHGHKWPGPEVVGADLIVVGHTHYSFVFEDKIGARIIEPIWVRGKASDVMKERYPRMPKGFILMPSFNPLLSTKPINSKRPTLYGPLLRNGYLDVRDARMYLFDGTELGKVGDLVPW